MKATGSSDGSTWTNASNNLQAMINASSAGDIIFVAAGTYIPIYTADGWKSSTNSYPTTNGNRDNAFVLKQGVKIYGGFAGTETDCRDGGGGIENFWYSSSTLTNDGIAARGVCGCDGWPDVQNSDQ